MNKLLRLGSNETERKLALLDSQLMLSLSLNDLRIMVGCLRALKYQMDLYDESYLDEEGLALKLRLEEAYRSALERLGI